MSRVKAVAANGQLGTGFLEQSLADAVEGADFIGCDAGSTDPGPYFLGSGEAQASDRAIARDLALIIEHALERNIPALIGSAGTAGGRPHLDRTARIVRELAAERGWRFPLALVDSEHDPATVADLFRRGALRPLRPAPDLDVAGILGAERFVAMLGPEAFQEALGRGAQVVLAGRSSDTSIFAAQPMLAGIPPAVAYHAAKTLECGAAAVVERLHPDTMMATMDPDGFTVEPPNPAMRCTPQSVASHTLYENSDPFLLVEPHGQLDTTHARYEATNDRAVRVTGSRFSAADGYSVRLEGARRSGYRTVIVAGIRDPLVIRQLDSFVDATTIVIRKKVGESLGLPDDAYQLGWRVYGRDGTMGALEPTPRTTGHEVGVVIDIVAADQDQAAAVASIAWHTALHQPIPEYSGLVSHLAFPFSPPAIDVGPVFEFCINHVWEVDDPRRTYSLQIEDVR